MEVTEMEMIQNTIEEFSRLQTYMIATPKEAESYNLMKIRYEDLKVMLQSFGINLTNIDRIKE